MFPISSTYVAGQVSADNEELPSRSSLFPAYSSINAESSTSSGVNEIKVSDAADRYDWLENSSFKTEDAISLHKLQVKRDEEDAMEQSLPDKRFSVGTMVTQTSPARFSQSDDEDSRLLKKHKKHKKHKHKTKDKKHHRKNKIYESDHRKEEIREAVSAVLSLERKNLLEEVPASSGKVFIEDVFGLQSEHAFRIDRQPDKYNLIYGELYKMHIAKYKKFRGGVLGCSTTEHLFKSDKLLNSFRFFSKSSLSKIYDEENVIDLTKKAAPKMDKFQPQSVAVTCDFLHFIKAEVKPNSAANPLGIYDTATEMYIQGKAHSKEEKLSPAGDASVDTFKETFSARIARQVKEFNANLRKNPDDINKWLEFVNFQDECGGKNSLAVSMGEKLAQKRLSSAIIEKKVAIIDRAIENNATNVTLKLKRISLCREVWDFPQLLEEWKRLLFIHVNDIEVWKKYLMFMQSNLSSFTLSDMVKTYEKCVLKLVQLNQASLKTNSQSEDFDKNVLDIILQLCHFLKQSGHSEKAVSIMQAVIEFNLYRPTSLTPTDATALFEVFWDGCCPRFGEDGAVGWEKWLEDKDTTFPPPITLADLDPQDIIQNCCDNDQISHVWLRMESDREKRFWLPWRPDVMSGEGQEDCDDPDRVVLFDDVAPFLIYLSKKEYIRIILDFLRLVNVELTWSNFSTKNKDFANIMNNRIFKPSDLFSGQHSSDVCGVKLSNLPEVDNETHHRYVRHVFVQISGSNLSTCDKSNLRLVWINYEICRILNISDKIQLKQTKKEVKKLIKTVLSENRNDLDLWTLYAQFECVIGNSEEACKVFDSAVTLNCTSWSKIQTISGQKSACNLYRVYCDSLLGFNNFILTGIHTTEEIDITSKITLPTHVGTRILYLLACFSENITFSMPSSAQKCSGPTILKTRKTLHEMFDKAFDNYLSMIKARKLKSSEFQYNIHDAAHIVQDLSICYAMFQYFTVGSKGSSVVFEMALNKLRPVIDNFLDNSTDENNFFVGSIRSTQERLYIRHLHLLQSHVRWSATSLTVFRTSLHQALQEYPDSPIFLQCLINLESSGLLVRNLRRYFDRTKISTSAVHWLFAIYAELKRLRQLSQMEGFQGAETGISHRIRSLFERGIECNSTSRCLLLWRMYIAFEAQTSQKASKAVFYRALQNCPWAKLLYMDAVNYFPADLQEVVDLMTEKEIRLRTLPEELEIWMGKPSQ